MPGFLRALGKYFLGIGTHGDYRARRARLGEFDTDPRDLRGRRTASCITEALDLGIARLGATAAEGLVVYKAIEQENPYILVGIPLIEASRGIATFFTYTADRMAEKRERRRAAARGILEGFTYGSDFMDTGPGERDAFD